MTLIDQLIRHEGERLKPYRCTAGKLTIGVGRNLDDVGISTEESRLLLNNDIKASESDLYQIFPEFQWFAQTRRWALIDLRLNLGPARFRTFKNMIAAINREDWQRAGDEALDSRWAGQAAPARVACIVRQLKEGA